MTDKKTYPDAVQADFTTRDPVSSDVDPVMLRRFSTRAFKPVEVNDQTLRTLFDAARQAPSCFNEQPWRFFCASRARIDRFAEFLEFLVPDNAEWAKNCSALIIVSAEKNFNHNNKANAHSWFDSGAAWFSLTYQARLMGLYTHAMAGINHEKIISVLNISESQEVICAIAVGVIDQQGAAAEEITPRKTLDEILSLS